MRTIGPAARSVKESTSKAVIDFTSPVVFRVNNVVVRDCLEASALSGNEHFCGEFLYLKSCVTVRNERKCSHVMLCQTVMKLSWIQLLESIRIQFQLVYDVDQRPPC